MSKPATEMRLARAAEGFTQVINRGNSHIITKNPATGKFAYDRLRITLSGADCAGTVTIDGTETITFTAAG